MDATHLHLLTNHIPILTTIFSVLILGWGIFKSEKNLQNLAMIGFIIAGVLSIVVLQSGEGAEETVESLAGVTENVIHNHEEAAETTNWIAMVMGVMAIGGFVLRKTKPRLMKGYLWILLIGGMLSAGMFSYTAYLGGHIRHTEIRPDTAETQLQLEKNQPSGEAEAEGDESI